MELMIDGVRCDTPSSNKILHQWSIASLRSVNAQRQGWEVTLNLPITPTNSAIMEYADQAHMVERFNHRRHTARLQWEGTTLFEGRVHLLCCNLTDPQTGYTLRIRGDTADWAHSAAVSPLDALDIDFSMDLTPEKICASWTNGSPVRFLPIIYDDYQSEYASNSVMSVERILSTDNYHPFLHAATLVKRIVEQQGYQLHSRFLESDFFQEIYFSGAYPRLNVEARKRRLDFLARRTAEKEATADTAGTVFALPHQSIHSVGNLVDAFTPTAQDDEGNTLNDCFTANNCLKMEEGRLLYRPLDEVAVGFEYHLHYKSDYRILNRTQLSGFDSVYLGEGADFRFQLANRFKDRRQSLTPGQNYLLVVFNHTENEQYRLILQNGVTVAEFSTRTASVTLPSTEGFGLATLFHRVDGVWLPTEEDWALYDGYITEQGSTEVELTLRTSPENLGPSAPKYFDQIRFYGAEPGMRLTLKKSTRLVPYFSSRPGYGSALTWRDVSALEIYQGELLEALGHLFNWRIFTDEQKKRVIIEPEEEFYASERVVDWSDRILQQEFLLEESDREEHALRLYGYLEGDGSVERFNNRTGEHFGRWSVQMDSTGTLSGVERLTNPLFSPTLNTTGYFKNAPSSSVPVVGNRDDIESVDTLSFTPRIVCYKGLRPLPATERWGYPAEEGSYPFAAFHFAGEEKEAGFTLCFEDREGVPGLHRFYDHEMRHRNLAQRLRVSLLIGCDEMEALGHYSWNGEVGINVTFRLKIEEEPVRARLEKIESYDPEHKIARCCFTLLSDDRL